MSISRWFAYPLGFAVWLASSRAHCQTAVRGLEAPAPCPRPVTYSEYRHDGFFARAQSGLVLFSAHVRDSLGTNKRSRIRAYGQSSDLAVGATVAPGLVVGMSVFAALLDPTFIENGAYVAPDDDSVKETLARLGPFLDWYPTPSRGPHVQLAAGLALLVESDVKGNPIEPGAVGVALAVGFGYEWFVSPQVSLGFMVRTNGGHVTRSAVGRNERTLWAAPELALTYTYH